MTNDTPPKVCLTVLGFMTMVLDSQDPMSSSLALEGGTMMFMTPELLAPSGFGLRNTAPTQKGDIYTFGLVILQVLVLSRCDLAASVLETDGTDQALSVIKPLELAYHVPLGVRPEKPANADRDL